MKRILATLCFYFSVSFLALAQEGQVFHLRTFDGSSVTNAKLACAAMFSIDPDARVSFDRDRLKVGFTLPTNSQMVIGRLAQYGAGDFVLVAGFGKIDRVDSDGGSASIHPSAEDYPTEEELGTAKQQWATQHPDAHQQYLRSLRAVTPVAHE